MGKTTPLSPALGGGSRRDDTGGQLLKELEALSQALYNAGQHNGRPPRKESPSSPYLASISGPRRQEPVSPYLSSKGVSQQPPSPLIGNANGQRRESRSEEPPSPYLGSYDSRRESRSAEPPSPYLGARGGGPPSPYLGGLGGNRNEPQSPVIVSLSGAAKVDPKSPYLGRTGSRREGGGRPPLLEPVSPHISASRGYEPQSPHLGARRMEELPSSPYLEARRGEEARSTHVIGQRGDDQPSPGLRSRLRGDSGELPSPSLRARSRSDSGSPYLGSMRKEPARYLSRIEESGNPNERDDRGAPSPYGNEPKSPYLGGRAEAAASPRTISESYSRSIGGITTLTLSSAAAALSSPLKRPAIGPARSVSSPLLAPSRDPGKRIQTYRLDTGREKLESGNGQDRAGLQPWHSQGFEKNLPELTNFPAWLEDNLQFSKKLEAPKEKKSLWNWKPFRVIAQMGHQRINCLFTVHVHGIEGLPAVMNGLRLAVSWKRKESQALTMPSRVFQGSCEFEETLNLRSTVYGSKTGKDGMKYMPKNYDLAVIALDIDELVLGKHRLDLSRLLPESSEDKSSDDEGDRSWTTSFKLVGKAKGGTLVVTFGCQLLNKDFQPTNSLSSARYSESPLMRPLRSFTSLPSSPQGMMMKAGRHSDVNFSPAMSEVPAHEYMNMEHLSLDEFSPGEGPFSIIKSSQKGQRRPDLSNGFPGTQKRLSFNQPPPVYDKEENFPEIRKTAFDEEEDTNFTVIHQGHEVSTILDSSPATEYDDPKAEEDTVEGLTDTDADTQEEESAEDPAVIKAQVSVDVSDSVQVKFEDKSLRVGTSDKAFQQSSQEAVEQGTIDVSPMKLEEPTISDSLRGHVNLESHHELEQRLADGEAEEKQEDGHGIQEEDVEHEEDVATAQEQSSEEIVKDLADLSRSWSAGLPASFVQEYPIRREQLKFGGKEYEKEINVVPEETLVEGDKGLMNVHRAAGLTEPKETKHEESRADAIADDEFDAVAGEFLSLLRDEKGSTAASSESGEDSPRALLLQQFEQEALLEGGLDLNFTLPEYAKFTLEGLNDEQEQESAIKGDQGQPFHRPTLSEDFANSVSGWGSDEDMELSSILEAAEAELQKATQAICSKARVKMLEDEETKALMQEWGLNDKTFSPPQLALDLYNASAIVPVSLAPSLGKGLGSVLHIRDGGSLRSMNPAHFQAIGATGQLLMQVSKPIVMPSGMGTTSMEMLRGMALAGMEAMAAQAMMAMPLEDITGKTLDQITHESRAPGFTYSHGNRRNGFATLGYGEKRNGALKLGYGEISHGSNALSVYTNPYSQNKRNSVIANPTDEYMPIEDLAPMAMEKIEALTLEGLKVQADMADQDAPCSVDPQAGSRRAGGFAGLPMLELEGDQAAASFGNSEEEGNLLSMAISLDEWTRLDAGVSNESKREENTSAILAAHNSAHNKVAVVLYGRQKDKDAVRQKSGRKGDANNDGKIGFMGSTVTLSMLVQLRDSLRNNEAIGGPMMALVQAERLVNAPRPKAGRHTYGEGNILENEEQASQPAQFKIVDVTLSGLQSNDTISSRKRVWGNQKQLQTGSRWLIANGVTKPSRSHPVFNGKASPARLKVQQGESLWSLSGRVHGSSAKWREVGRLHPHIRNPDIIFSNTKTGIK